MASRDPETLERRLMLTVSFLFDYSHDSSGFFGTAERAVLEAAGQRLTESMQDTLTEIVPQKFDISDTWTVDYEDPSTGTTFSVQDAVLGEGEIVVYVGAQWNDYRFDRCAGLD